MSLRKRKQDGNGGLDSEYSTGIAESEIPKAVSEYTIVNMSDAELPVLVLKDGKEVLVRIGPYKSMVVEKLTGSIRNLSENKRMLKVIRE